MGTNLSLSTVAVELAAAATAAAAAAPVAEGWPGKSRSIDGRPYL